MTLGALSMVWIAAEAEMPLEWVLAGVWRNQEMPGDWQAAAKGLDEWSEIEVGHGGDPVRALHRLADALRERRQGPAIV